MSSLNCAPLFPTSLRTWQATWKASQAPTADSGPTAAPGVSRNNRLARLKRRPRRGRGALARA
jgi:hypothetical protein